jgi:ribosomal protein S18 acetylase RimI-like enzyme
MSQSLKTSKGEFRIRIVVPQDATALRKLRLESLVNHPTAFSADLIRSEVEPAEAWAQRINDNAEENTGVISVAVDGNRLVGMTGLVLGKSPKTRHSGLIWGVYVKSEWRGLGIAGALLEACVNWGQTQGMTIVKLAVADNNTSAIRTYVRSGFKVYGVEPQALRYQGLFFDELLMARSI